MAHLHSVLPDQMANAPTPAKDMGSKSKVSDSEIEAQLAKLKM